MFFKGHIVNLPPGYSIINHLWLIEMEGWLLFSKSGAQYRKNKTFPKLKILVDKAHPEIEFYSSSYALRTCSLPFLLVFH